MAAHDKDTNAKSMIMVGLVHSCGFASAIRPQQTEKFALSHLQVHIINSDNIFKLFTTFSITMANSSITKHPSTTKPRVGFW
jgi:hypothetical protein